jgi:hypothetical protein
MTRPYRGIHALLVAAMARRTTFSAMTGRGWRGIALLISGMIVSQWNSESRPAAALAPE